MFFVTACKFDCNKNGTVGDGQCNQVTGECNCKDGMHGDDCGKGEIINDFVLIKKKIQIECRIVCTLGLLTMIFSISLGPFKIIFIYFTYPFVFCDSMQIWL